MESTADLRRTMRFAEKLRAASATPELRSSLEDDPVALAALRTLQKRVAALRSAEDGASHRSGGAASSRSWAPSEYSTEAAIGMASNYERRADVAWRQGGGEEAARRQADLWTSNSHAGHDGRGHTPTQTARRRPLNGLNDPTRAKAWTTLCTIAPTPREVQKFTLDDERRLAKQALSCRRRSGEALARTNAEILAGHGKRLAERGPRPKSLTAGSTIMDGDRGAALTRSLLKGSRDLASGY